MTGRELLLQDALTTAIKAEQENVKLLDENNELRLDNKRLRRGYFVLGYFVCAIVALQVLVMLVRC